MSKKTHWEHFASLNLGDFHDFKHNCPYTPTKKEVAVYRKRMFKWGEAIRRMETEKVKLNKKPEKENKEEQ